MSIRDAVLAEVLEEWSFFGGREISISGQTITTGKKEYENGFYQRVGMYWQSLGAGYAHLDGLNRDMPWSAAFISYVFRSAGAKTAFPYSASHAKWIHRSIRQKLDNVGTAKLLGHRLTEYAPQPGDLIGCWRETATSYDDAATKAFFYSHTDIVVEVSGRLAWVIGGNVGESVTRRPVRLDENGHVNDKSAPWFVVIENRI